MIKLQPATSMLLSQVIRLSHYLLLVLLCTLCGHFVLSSKRDICCTNQITNVFFVNVGTFKKKHLVKYSEHLSFHHV